MLHFFTSNSILDNQVIFYLKNLWCEDYRQVGYEVRLICLERFKYFLEHLYYFHSKLNKIRNNKKYFISIYANNVFTELLNTFPVSLVGQNIPLSLTYQLRVAFHLPYFIVLSANCSDIHIINFCHFFFKLCYFYVFQKVYIS